VLRALILPAALALTVPAGPAWALELVLPGEAVLTREEVDDADSYRLPVGAFADGRLPVREVEGHVTRQAWRIEGTDISTLRLLAPLRDQLRDAGYDILFDCASEECGGFDFRFATSVLPAPDMFVDLFDFRFLAAHKGNGNGIDYISFLVSVSGGAGYIQLVTVGTGELPRIEPAAGTAMPDTAPVASAVAGSLVEMLVSEGHAVLGDLDFGSGSATLSAGAYDSLAALAGFLKEDGERRIALVGHTDAVGGLDDNLALSRERAASVLDRLVESHGAARAQLEAAGVGYLAPTAPNTTPEGRAANRRVEAVLLSAGPDR